MKRFILGLFCCLFACSFALAGNSPEGQAARQARSVHLFYKEVPKDAKVFYMEACVVRAAPGSYYCLIGFKGGYAGIQQLRNGQHIAIFSLWEPSNPFDFSADPNKVDASIATRCLYAGEGVDASRFGGEGTGGKSMVPFAWEVGRPVRMAVSVGKDEDPERATYTGWIYSGDQWFRIAVFSSAVNKGDMTLREPYSFIEDFMRNVKSRDEVRVACFSPLWAHNGEGWTECSNATFSADGNALKTIDAGAASYGFWCATGGQTVNKTTQLSQEIKGGGAALDSSEEIRQSLVEAIRALEPSF